MNFIMNLYLRKNNKLQQKLILIIFFAILFAVGSNIYQNYGISLDEEETRKHGFMSLRYIYEIFFPSQTFTIDNYIAIPKLLDFFSKDHGPILDTLFAFIEITFGFEESRVQYLFRHYSCFIIFFIGVYFFYLIGKFRFNDWRIGLLGSVFLVLSPRIFAESFYNNKDVAFMSLFIISLYCCLKFIYKPNLKHAFTLALSSAFATDLRLMGIILPFLTLFFIIILSLREKNFLKKNFFITLVFLVLVFSFIIIFWPYLWSDPITNFFLAFNKFSNFPWAGKNLYFSQYVDASYVPWHYSLTWISITTPFLYVVLFVFGFSIALTRIIKRLLNIEEHKKLHDLWRGKKEMLDLMILLNFFLPIFLVIIFNSTLLDGWRHLYFVYPSFLLLSLYGFKQITRIFKKKNFHNYFILLVILTLAINVVNMIKIHPYQNVYFNFLAGKKIENKFEVDYWALSNKQALEFILLNNNKDYYKIYPASHMNINTSKLIFSNLKKKKIKIVNKKSEADFIISNGRFWRGNPDAKFAKIPNNFELYKEISTDRVKIVSIFKKSF